MATCTFFIKEVCGHWVPDEIRVEAYAALHRLGVAVELSGWRPPELTEGFENDLFLAPDCYVPERMVQVTPVPESDRMENSLGEKIAAITIGVGLFLAFLISMIVLFGLERHALAGTYQRSLGDCDCLHDWRHVANGSLCRLCGRILGG
ncbi:MAG: hypothetical protein U0894_08805 [Pirellulales bacterium]